MMDQVKNMQVKNWEITKNSFCKLLRIMDQVYNMQVKNCKTIKILLKLQLNKILILYNMQVRIYKKNMKNVKFFDSSYFKIK